jgi:hypothetical protein
VVIRKPQAADAPPRRPPGQESRSPAAFDSAGRKVTRLHRVAFGSIELGPRPVVASEASGRLKVSSGSGFRAE